MSDIYTQTERTAILQSGNAHVRGAVAAEGDDDRVQLRIWQQTNTPSPATCLSVKLSDLRAYLAELERLARENRGLRTEAGGEDDA